MLNPITNVHVNTSQNPQHAFLRRWSKAVGPIS